MTTPRKKLIEVSMPLEVINTASAREKSVRHGHPSTLHLWWARRPLAACRAVLFGQLVDDPSAWPERFPTPEARERERERLHGVIAEFVEWPKSTAADQARWERALDAGRYEIARSVAWGRGEEPPKERPAVLAYLAEHAPPVYDPFCGGGSIPLEAQRLGLRAYGSDLNPVAVLISKALVEIPPKFAGMAPVHPGGEDHLRQWRGAQGLAEDVRHYGAWMREQAKARIGHLYPDATLPDGRKATVIAWLWARTVRSPHPAARGASVPLASSFVLSAVRGNEAVVRLVRDRAATDGWRFEVEQGGLTEPDLDVARDGTKQTRGSFVCALTGSPILYEYIDDEANAGRLGARLMAVVAEGDRGRAYLAPSTEHERIASTAVPLSWPETPCRGTFASNAQGRRYGFAVFADYFTDRQLVALECFSELVADVRARALTDAEAAFSTQGLSLEGMAIADGGRGPQAYVDAVATYLGFAVSSLADRLSSLCTWDAGGKTWGTKIRNTFARQGIAMSWDFAEVNPLSSQTGSIENTLEYSVKALEAVSALSPGDIFQRDAPANSYPVRPVVISTDPPYYDNIGYADLSDFFYVWLRRSLADVWPALFRRLQTPKQEELVATPYRFGGKDAAEAHFMEGMSRALHAMRAANVPDTPLAIYYAFKQSEKSEDGVSSPGWASFLQAVVNAGLVVDGTWPVRTELANRMIGMGANALASSIVLSCRARPSEAPSTTRREFTAELRRELAAGLATIRTAGLHPVDIPQSALGPGMAVFSKYAVVREPDDSAMSVGRALALINQVRGEIDDAEVGGLDPETRFAIDWFASFGWSERDAGEAIKLAQSYDLAERQLRDAGVLLAERGKARLLRRAEMPADWRPSRDRTLTTWELAQALNRALNDGGGVSAAGALLAEAQSLAVDACWLAGRLFSIAEDRRMTDEALSWGNLAEAWGDIERAATAAPAPPASHAQPELI